MNIVLQIIRIRTYAIASIFLFCCDLLSVQGDIITIDFENLGLSEGNAVGNVAGVSFINAQIAVQGTPGAAFAVNGNFNDTGNNAPFSVVGNTFITATGATLEDTLRMDFSSFSSGGVRNVQFLIADIDGSEGFTVIARDDQLNALEAIQLIGFLEGNSVGDGVVAPIIFTTTKLISFIDTTNVPGFSGGLPGHGIDSIRFNTVTVPEPNAIALFMLMASFTIFFMSRQKRYAFLRKEGKNFFYLPALMFSHLP